MNCAIQVMVSTYVAVNMNSVPPLVKTLDTYSTLGEKNRGPDFDTFSPGTEYHFARFEGSELTICSLL
jgi:hypothetical protein